MPQGPAPASPTKRPRRSGASIFMRAMEKKSNNYLAEGRSTDDETDESEHDTMPAPSPDAELLPSAAPSEGMEGVEFSFHLPGRMRPSVDAARGGNDGPLAVVPSPRVNRGLPSISNTLGIFVARKSGSVRVVRAE